MVGTAGMVNICCFEFPQWEEEKTYLNNNGKLKSHQKKYDQPRPETI